MKKTKRTASGLIVDMFLAGIMLALYVLTVLPGTGTALAQPVVYSGQSADAAALQFTVDYSASSLSGILDTLRDAGVNVTFAVSKEWAQNNPELLKRMAAEGHELAVMGDGAGKSAREAAKSIAATVELIEEQTGQRPALCYTDGGKRAIRRAAKMCGLITVSATVDLMCARGNSQELVFRASTEAFAGSIMLMQPTRLALMALPEIIQAISTKGLRVVRTCDVVKDGIL